MPTQQTYRVMRFRGRWARQHLVPDGRERALCGASGGRIDGEARTEPEPPGPYYWPVRLRIVPSDIRWSLCWHCERLATGYP